jgi:hypothetical protein
MTCLQTTWCQQSYLSRGGRPSVEKIRRMVPPQTNRCAAEAENARLLVTSMRAAR